jgi:hypothetical protein
MSFYDDSTLLFLAAGAVYKDGKINTIKPAAPNTRAPLLVTRGSNLTATRVDKNGLIEKGRENLFKQSNNFNTTPWASSVTLTSGQSGYDGSNDAWLLTKTSSGAQSVYNYINETGVMTMSVYAKAGSTNWMRLTQGGKTAYFDLSGSGAVGTSSNGIDQTITSVGNGWFRCTLTANKTTAGQTPIYPYTAEGDASGSTDSIYIQDSQFEQGLVATEYIESGASSGKGGLLENEPRFNYPIGGGSPHLLLEPSRTNLVSNNEYLEGNTEFSILSSSVTFADYTETSPDGNENALRVLEAEGSGSHNWYYSNLGGVTNGTTYCISFFAKSIRGRNISINEGGVGMDVQGIIDLSDGSILADVHNNISVEPYGNGWYRISAVGAMNGTSQRIIFYSVDGTSTSFEGNTTSGVSLWGVQLEEGSYPTSYIPNHSGGSVSRELELVQTADVSSLNLIGQNEGVFFLDYEFLDGQTAESQNWIALESENGQERVLIYKSPSNSKIQVYHVANNSLVFNYNTNVTIVPNTRYKIAFKYSSGDIAVVINGSLIVTNSSTYTRGSDLSRVIFNESNVQPSCKVHQTIVLTSGWDNLDLAILTGLTGYYASFSAMATALNYTIYE